MKYIHIHKFDFYIILNLVLPDFFVVSILDHRESKINFGLIFENLINHCYKKIID